jgi:hypothetical protein
VEAQRPAGGDHRPLGAGTVTARAKAGFIEDRALQAARIGYTDPKGRRPWPPLLFTLFTRPRVPRLDRAARGELTEMEDLMMTRHQTKWRLGIARAATCGLFLAAALALGFAAPATAEITTQDIVDQIDVDSYYDFLYNQLYTHPGDDRGFGPEHDLARDNIQGFLESYGLDVYLHEFFYYGDPFYNVVAVKTGEVTPDQHYIIGAHFDSVDNPGADDNASGVAGVLEIARVLSEYDFESTMIFIAFDREEQGLWGSDAYATDHADDDIRGMISMDMIAYNTGANSVDIEGRSASNEIKQALASAVTEYSGGLSYQIGGTADYSDHAPFEWQGFQACLIIEDWGNPYYHTQNDHVEMPDYIDYDFAWKVTRSVCGWLVDAAGLIQPCIGDVDGSGAVDTADLLALLASWGPCEDCPADFDGDGEVGTADLLALLAAWGPCP